MCRRLAIPIKGFSFVLFYGASPFVVYAEIVLTGFIVLKGRLTVPFQSFGLIDGNAAACVVTPAEISLCYCISLLGRCGTPLPF